MLASLVFRLLLLVLLVLMPLCSSLMPTEHPPPTFQRHQHQHQHPAHHDCPAIIKELQRTVGGLSLVALALLGGPAPAPASQALQLEVDFPALLQVARDNQDAVKKLALQSANAVKLTGKPDNWIQFVRDAGAGDVIMEVNGLPIDVSLQSEKGVLDVGVWTDKADLSFVVSSQYLPKLPLLLKRFPVVTDVESAKEREVAFEEALAPAVPFSDQTTFDLLGKGWTNQQVLGCLSLGVGAAYASTYAYYWKGIQEQEEKAQKKREAAAEKRKAATGSRSAKQNAQSEKPKKEPKPNETKPKEVPAKEETVSTANRKVEVGKEDPVIASVSEDPSDEFAVPVSSNTASVDPPKKKRKWYKLGLR